ncbi:MAG: dihydroorotate dehydrogenase electron transfer subunit [Acidobacteriia bacterium]|nr:dihydroorotate dehydrogenase electron transfer subunit [Terriglobia bacterium]
MLDRRVRVKEVRNLGAANYLLTLSSPEQARLVHPGQFLMVKCSEEVDDNPLLRRPFSIFAIHPHARTGNPAGLEILVKDVGAGTHRLVQVRPGQELHTLGPQGRPFQLSKEMSKEVRFACLVAGGVGIAALYLLARELIALEVSPVLFYGARTAEELVLSEYFERLGIEIQYATEDGSLGERGLVTAPLTRFLKEHSKKGPRLYACGPWAMMRAVHALAQRHLVPCEVSLEARMGCSLGACMGCVVRASSDRGEAHYIRVCMEGPVIDSRMIDWESPPL